MICLWEAEELVKSVKSIKQSHIKKVTALKSGYEGKHTFRGNSNGYIVKMVTRVLNRG